MISLPASRILSFQVAILAALVIACVGFFSPLTTHALPPSSSEIDDGGDGTGDTGGGETTPAAATVSMSATPTSVQQGYASQLSYSSSSVTSCSINNGAGSVTANTSGYKTVSPSSTTTYTITCQTSAGGSVTATATVTVTAAPTPFTAYCEAGPDIAQVNETVQWYATHSSGSASNLAWKQGTPFTTKICTGGQNYTDLNSCPEGISNGDSCSVEGQRCKESAGCDGSTYTDGEGQPNAHTTYGSVIPYTCVASDTSATYSYAWTGTDGLSGVTQNISKAYASIGMKTARVTVTRNSGGSGTTSGYGWRAVGSQTGPTCTSDVNSVTGGADHRSQPTCSASTAGTRYTQYNIEAATQSTCPSAYRNNEYSVTGQEYVCEATSSSTAGTASASCSAEIVGKTPTATLSANPSSIQTGSSSTLSWGSTNANACTLNEGIGSVGTSGSRTVAPGSTTTYTLVCTAPGSATSGTWRYYDEDYSDYSCPLENTNKAYSSLPNCPANPEGKACTGSSLCKVNTLSGHQCTIHTALYQCAGSSSSPAQSAIASAKVTVTAAPTLPDLTAGSISPTTATAGTAQTFTATVSNIGTANAGASATRFQRATSAAGAGATSISDVSTAAITAGGNLAKSAPYTFSSAGTYYVRACADTGVAVPESNEDNNCGAWTAVTVSTAATPTVSCAVSPTSVSPGGSVTYRANPAGGASAPFTWAASDGASMGTAATASRTFSTPGTYAMNVRASGTAVSYCPNVVVAASWCTNRPTDLSITATPNRVRSGQSVALAWSATGVNGENATCTVSGPGVSWSSLVTGVPQCSASGSANTTIQTQSTYTLTCAGVSESVTVNVIPNFTEF